MIQAALASGRGFRVVLIDMDNQDDRLYLDAMVVDDGTQETVENLDTRNTANMTPADCLSFTNKYRTWAAERNMTLRISEAAYNFLSANGGF